MYPKLHHLINDILGIKISLPIQTFGFFVALAFGIGSYYLYSELKRKEIQGILKPFYEEQIINPPFNIFDWLGGIFISFFMW